MVVYIEYVLLDNLVIDYFLLKAAFSISKTPYKKIRIFLSAVLGAVFALLYPLMQIHTVILTVIKILFGFLLVLISGTFKNAKEYYINSVLFILLTFLTGGAIIGAYSVLGIDYSSEISIAVMVIPAFAVIKSVTAVIKYIYRRKTVLSEIYDCEISVGGSAVSLRGFFDTGNELFDGDSPVIIVDKRISKRLLSDISSMMKIKYITLKTVSGEDKMLSVKSDKISINIGDRINVYSNITVCFAKGSVGSGYDVILHPALMEGKNELKSAEKVKKVS